jgi:hypothetical protein
MKHIVEVIMTSTAVERALIEMVSGWMGLNIIPEQKDIYTPKL